MGHLEFSENRFYEQLGWSRVGNPPSAIVCELTRSILQQNKSLLTITPWLITGAFWGDRLDDGREFTLSVDAGQRRDVGAGPVAHRQGGRDMAGAGLEQGPAEHLHTGRQISDLHQDRRGLDDETPDSLGTRLARLCRVVGEGLRILSRGI